MRTIVGPKPRLSAERKWRDHKCRPSAHPRLTDIIASKEAFIYQTVLARQGRLTGRNWSISFSTLQHVLSNLPGARSPMRHDTIWCHEPFQIKLFSECDMHSIRVAQKGIGSLDYPLLIQNQITEQGAEILIHGLFYHKQTLTRVKAHAFTVKNLKIRTIALNAIFGRVSV